MDYTKWHFIILVVIAVAWVSASEGQTVIATTIDNGCNTRIDIPAKSEYREYNEGNL